MKKFKIRTEKPYTVAVGNKCLLKLPELLKKQYGKSTAVIITDDNVSKIYEEDLTQALKYHGIPSLRLSIIPGERSKNRKVAMNLLDSLADRHITRNDYIIALGGGVVGDIAGFVASIYLRGIPLIQVPTSLLAMIDSSIGGKNGVNLLQGKNMIGTFYQPSLVWEDASLFDTMKWEPLSDGIAEAVKYGVLGDPLLLQSLKNKKLLEDREDIICRCIRLKKELIEEDPYDTGNRRLLNLGHTLGHAIEGKSGYKITHGHAISMGMVMIAGIGARAGICRYDTEAEIADVLSKYYLPTECPFSIDELMPYLLHDKKSTGDEITFVFPQTIGECCLYSVKKDRLESFLKGK